MSKLTHDQLVEQFPLIFKKVKHVECNEGWYPLLEQLFTIIEHHLKYAREEVSGGIYLAQCKEKFGCYDDKTEVLTMNGWKQFEKVSLADKIATLKDGEYLEYQSPTDIMSYDYCGKMYCLKTRGVNLLVTPNHNLYLSKGTYYNGKCSPPKKVTYPFELTTYQKFLGKNKRFKKSATWMGREEDSFVLPKYENHWVNSGIHDHYTRHFLTPETSVPMDGWLNFLGWYIAEGCSDKNRGDVRIACNNTDGGAEKKTITEAIDSIKYRFSLTAENKPALLFCLFEKRLSLWLSENCGSNAYDKHIPSFVKELCPRQITILLNSLFLGDGHQTETANILTTVSRQLANDVEELLIKAGYSFREYKSIPAGMMVSPAGNGKIYRTQEVFNINWLKHSNYHNTSDKGMAKGSFEGLVDYNGKVYCVTVPNHIILVRRGGVSVWCGNSLRCYMENTTPFVDGAIALAEYQSGRICEMCGNPGQRRGGGWVLTLCDACQDAREKERNK